MSELIGNIFNIQSYSIHDGPGIRTTVFFKGCPLRCKWCQNPESQKTKKQLLVALERCTGCGQCAGGCPKGAVRIVSGRAVTDRDVCSVCGQCADLCPEGIREICGEAVTVPELLKRVLKDRIFMENSGGGVTASGGEALAQAGFVAEFFKSCKFVGLHTALDTSGFASWESLKRVAAYTDLVLYDIKHMDSEKHKALTGVPNERILENLKMLSKENVEIYIRVPIIPGMNDSDKNICDTADFVLKELGGRYKTFLLPYHRLGEAKLDSLEEKEGFLRLEPPSFEHMEHLKHFFDERGLAVQIGG